MVKVKFFRREKIELNKAWHAEKDYKADYRWMSSSSGAVKEYRWETDEELEERMNEFVKDKTLINIRTLMDKRINLAGDIDDQSKNPEMELVYLVEYEDR